jgi:hypothetical protein
MLAAGIQRQWPVSEAHEHFSHVLHRETRGSPPTFQILCNHSSFLGLKTMPGLPRSPRQLMSDKQPMASKQVSTLS